MGPVVQGSDQLSANSLCPNQFRRLLWVLRYYIDAIGLERLPVFRVDPVKIEASDVGALTIPNPSGRSPQANFVTLGDHLQVTPQSARAPPKWAAASAAVQQHFGPLDRRLGIRPLALALEDHRLLEG
jgi:hypothetical protein